MQLPSRQRETGSLAGPAAGSVQARLRQRVADTPGSRPATIDDRPFPPELARHAEQPPIGNHWLHEVKWDGYRMLAAIVGGRPRIWSRNGIEWTRRLPAVVDALAGLGVEDARLDGELIVVSNGRSDFSALQATLAGERPLPLVYMLFDLLHVVGHDLCDAPLIDRKGVLETLLAGQASPHLRYSTHLRGNGEAAFATACEQGLEGILSKRAESPYRPGRGDDWLKLKRLDSASFAVVGFTAPKGARSGFGSLLLARPDDGGWRYVGRVGSGFDERSLQRLATELHRDARREPTVRLAGIDPALRAASWVAPQRVVEVWFRGSGRLGLLRQPSLKGLREDLHADDLRADGTRRLAGRRDDGAGAIVVTHPERVIYPGRGTTKQQVVDYYRAVMDWLLPGIAGRPLSIVRCPNGIDETCFFQKHATAGLQRVATVRLEQDAGAAGDYLLVENPSALLELVQRGATEFHPWGSTARLPELADRLVFDLDPGPGVDWKQVTAAARQLRGLLQRLGLVSFLRTTGGNGLHVVLPLRPAVAWPQAKAFAHAFAASLAEAQPERFVAVAAKQHRDGRIFVDYLRNARGATAIASYSLRARAGAPVAVPLRWNELARLETPLRFDIDSVPRRLARLDADPWEGIDRIEQDLAAVVGRVGGDGVG